MEGLVLANNPCAYCGGEVWTRLTKRGFLRKKKYCGKRCLNAIYHSKIRKQRCLCYCVVCGSEYKGHGLNKSGTCSPECCRNRGAGWSRLERAIARIHKRISPVPAPKGHFVTMQCCVCSKAFVRRYRFRTGQCCSRQCAAILRGRAASQYHAKVASGVLPKAIKVVRYWSLQAEIQSLKRIGKNQRRAKALITTCADCGQTFRRSRMGRMFCDACSTKEASSRRQYVKAVSNKIYTCRVCAAQFCKLRGSASNHIVGDWCSETCRLLGIDATKRSLKQKYRSFRDAHERGVQPGSMKFDPFEVFHRDEWKCKNCKVDTPERLRGTYEPDAPELDHIIPLSRGGWHAPDNCQTLCRSCNADKGVMLPDEWKGKEPKTLRLF